MKIIAHSGKDKVLIEATHDEVAHLFGKRAIDTGYGGYDTLPKTHLAIGIEIKVDAAYQYVGWIYNHRDRFERIANELRRAADSVDKFPELYEFLSIPEKSK